MTGSTNPCGRSPTAGGPINDRFRRGLATLQAIGPDEAVRLLGGVSDIAPDFAAYLVEYAYGDISSRPGLDLKSRELVAVSALAALGCGEAVLKPALSGALRLGWTTGELVEALMQISVHAGFPAALNGLAALKSALVETGQAPTD